MKNSFSLSKIVVFMLFSFVCTNYLFAQNGQKWSTGGNTGSASDFLGTTNAAALIFKTNNTEYFQIDANGNIIVKSFMGNYSGIVLSNTAGILNKLDFNGNAAQYLAGDGNFKDISATSGWLLDHNNLTTVQNCNVGIGVSHPTEKLDIDGNIKTTGIVYANGGLVVGTFKQGIAIVTTSLGVGTNNPTEQVDVMGNIKASGTVFANFINSPKIITNRITSTDTVIYIGDSTLAHSNIGPDRIWSDKYNSGLGLGVVSYGRGRGSVGIGRYTDAYGQYSYTLGTDVSTTTNATGSIVMGSGFDFSNATRLINDKPNTLMVGFNSTVPTLFISPSPGPANNTIGKVGIGTVNPEETLDVRGNIQCGGHDFILGKYDNRANPSGGHRALVHDGWDEQKDELIINYAGDFIDGVRIMAPLSPSIAPSLSIDGKDGAGASGPALEINAGTSTGIKVTSQQGAAYGYCINVNVDDNLTKAFAVSKGTTENFILYGNGDVYSRSIHVKVGTLGDFVFDNDYDLLSIPALENYIKLNHHLPQMPSAKEVKENGMDVGEFQNLLLQKTEEQALYIISLQKQIDEMNTKIQQLEKK